MAAKTRRVIRAARQARERAKRRKRFEHFLRLVESGARTRTALRKTGLDWRADIARWFSSVPLYAARIKRAQAAGHERRREELLDELWRVGVEGVPEPMISCGKVAAVRIVKSDSALIALARKYLPHLFRHEKPALTAEETQELKTLIRKLEASMAQTGENAPCGR